MVVVVAALTAALALLWWVWPVTAPDPADRSTSMAPGSRSSAPNGTFQPLVGRWRRNDGGYVLDIRAVDDSGRMEARYFNPRPIRVSKARAARHEGRIGVMVELRDAGYPGSTYDLLFDPGQNRLVGIYYQPNAGRSFGVVFVR